MPIKHQPSRTRTRWRQKDRGRTCRVSNSEFQGITALRASPGAPLTPLQALRQKTSWLLCFHKIVCLHAKRAAASFLTAGARITLGGEVNDHWLDFYGVFLPPHLDMTCGMFAMPQHRTFRRQQLPIGWVERPASRAIFAPILRLHRCTQQMSRPRGEHNATRNRLESLQPIVLQSSLHINAMRLGLHSGQLHSLSLGA